VWVHKYDLLGLLTYWQYTKNPQAIKACHKVGELLCRTFGPGPRQRDINKAGEHVGMAACSVLEPVVLLYRATGDRELLDLAHYIVANYDAPTGPKILSALERTRSVKQVANGKAYEMLSNFNGLLELYRLTGERRLLDDMRIAWNDVVERRLNVSGTGSSFEVWNDDGDYPNEQARHVGETCVSVTWEQMCLQFLRLTGDGAFADQLERTVYNALLGAQKEDGASWDYYTSLQGVKPYTDALSCCISSGARGVALLPSVACMRSRDGGLVINFYNNGVLRTSLPGGKVTLAQRTNYPYDGTVDILLEPGKGGMRFPLRLRVPSWCPSAELMIDGKPVDFSKCIARGYAVLNRLWNKHTRIRLKFALNPRIVVGRDSNAGSVAIGYGPLVFAVDTLANPSVSDPASLSLASRTIFVEGTTEGPNRTFHLVALAEDAKGKRTAVDLVPFAIAGRDGKSRYAVWLHAPTAH
jgi:DUF1680 family protein